MVMLISIGFLLGRRPVEVFAIFLISFGIWDIFYYVFLKCLISWPSSFLTWDILFLIPVLWVGPVIAPILNSLVMVALGYLILLFSGRNVNPNLSKTEWIFLIGGAALVYISYTEEFTRYLRDHLPAEGIRQLSTRFIPQYYRWWLFLSGFFLHIAAIIHYTVRIRRLTRSILSPP